MILDLVSYLVLTVLCRINLLHKHILFDNEKVKYIQYLRNNHKFLTAHTTKFTNKQT